MQVPHDQLEPDTLTRLLVEFVTRDGTDYGERESTTEDKVAQVRKQLTRGEIVIVFDPETETTDLVSREEFRIRSLAQ